MHILDAMRIAPPHVRALIGVSSATWSRWLRGRSRVPAAVQALIRIVFGGELPHGGADWAGWRFRDGKLYDPTGTWHTPGTIQAWHWTRQQLQTLRAQENRNMPDNVRALPAARRAQTITAELYRRLDR